MGGANVWCTSIAVISIFLSVDMYKVTEYRSKLSTSYLHKSPSNSFACKWRNPPNPISRITCVCASLKFSIIAKNPNGNILVWKIFLDFMSVSSGFGIDCIDLGSWMRMAVFACCFRDLCCCSYYKTKSYQCFTGVFGLFWTTCLSLSACALANFFDIICICFSLDFDACFFFLILFTNTSSLESALSII